MTPADAVIHSLTTGLPGPDTAALFLDRLTEHGYAVVATSALTTADYRHEFARAERLAHLARLFIEGHTTGYPVENGETWEPDLVERFRAALADLEETG